MKKNYFDEKNDFGKFFEKFDEIPAYWQKYLK